MVFYQAPDLMLQKPDKDTHMVRKARLSNMDHQLLAMSRDNCLLQLRVIISYGAQLTLLCATCDASHQ